MDMVLTTSQRIAAFRARHPIVPIDETHPEFGVIHRCQSDGIRVHWLVRGYRHDTDEIKALLDEEYGGMWGFPKSDQERKERAIERISADFDEEVEFDREGQPEFNGSFR